MPSWKEHMKFCMEHGIDRDVCDFANRLIDFPEEMIPKLLKDDRLKEYLADRTGFTLEELERIREETEIVWKIKTGKICNECSFRKKCKFKSSKVKPKYYYLGMAKDAHLNKPVHVVINVQKNGNIQRLCLDEDKFNKHKNIIITQNDGINPIEFLKNTE